MISKVSKYVFENGLSGCGINQGRIWKKKLMGFDIQTGHVVDSMLAHIKIHIQTHIHTHIHTHTIFQRYIFSKIKSIDFLITENHLVLIKNCHFKNESPSTNCP